MPDQRVSPFLMYAGRAREAMEFYTSVFAGSEILSLDLYGPGEPGPEGSVRLATFALHGLVLMCIDSPANHAFTFTPSMSLYVKCDTEGEIDRATDMLSQGGAVLMPLGAYPFAKRFAWVADRFGVSWQLCLS
jgi:predicted 3-demethylubiquinone-9 3-methyltransferase (glyoxalase superfamily)